MGEKLEKQWLVSRIGLNPTYYRTPKPLVWFDSRVEARRFVLAKEARSKYVYRIDAIHRGPKA